jgi:hypothetical protein
LSTFWDNAIKTRHASVRVNFITSRTSPARFGAEGSVTQIDWQYQGVIPQEASDLTGRLFKRMINNTPALLFVIIAVI